MSRKGSYLAAGVSLAAVLALVAAPARASVIYTGSFVNSGTSQTDAATAQFSISGGTLTIVLINTSTFSAYHNPDVLSGVFFDIAGSQQSLTGSSAVASNIMGWSGSSGTLTAGPVDVSNQWGWKYSAPGFNSTNLTTSARYGIAAAGFSSLTPSFGHSNFNGTNTNLGGLSGSIVGSGFHTIAGNGGGATFADDSVTFTFTGLGSGITDSDIRNVTFGYGTAPDASDGSTTSNGGGLPVPEPTSVAILALGLAGLLLVRRRISARRG